MVHGARLRSSRSSRARSSTCTRAASPRTTPRTSATPRCTSPTTCSSGACATWATRPAACATSPTSTTRSSRKARELGVHYLDLAAAETARFDDDMRALDLLPVVERAPSHLGHRRHPRLHRDGARSRPRLPGRRRRVLRRVHLPRRSARCQRLRPRPDAGLRGRARRQRRRPAQARPARLRALAAVRSTTSPLGTRCGDRAGRAGTSSAPRWPCASSAPPSICTAAAPTSSSRTTSASGPSPRPPPASRSSATGCTRPWSAWTARRCRSRSATWCSSPSSARSWTRWPSGCAVIEQPLPHRVGVGRQPHARAAERLRPLAGRRPRRRRPRRGAGRRSTTTSTRPPRWPAVDAAAAAGQGVSAAAALLGVVL